MVDVPLPLEVASTLVIVAAAATTEPAMRRVALSLVLLVSATGCLPAVLSPLDAPPDRPDEGIAEPTTERDVVVSDETPTDPVPDVVVVNAPPPLVARSEPVLFRLGAGYGALGQVDFAPCREQGLDKGYLHMRVTFRRSGRVVHAIVERAAPPPDGALQCIAEQLQLAGVPVFDGEDVTLSRSYFVN